MAHRAIRNVIVIVIAAGFMAAGAGFIICRPARSAARTVPGAEQVIKLPSGPGPVDNPLKGWCTYTDGGPIRQPYSMVFRYVSWKDLEPREGVYRFDEWERRSWRDPLSAGRHIVFRVYIDHPKLPSGIPGWLLAKGLKTKRYTDYGGGLSPDYDDPNLTAGLERLIAALGRRYDRNPRVAFVELGMLGYWGEWHTYPHIDWFASSATQQRIVDAYRGAFPDKVLMARYADGAAGQQPWLGYHDDMFPSDTDGPEEWKFLPKMRRARRTENWKTAAIGGEMEPLAAGRWLGADYARTVAAVKSAHMSWIGPYSPAIDPNTSPEFLARSQDLVRMMGYQFALRALHSRSRAGELNLSVDGENQGVAPFYYPWPVKLALLDGHDRPAQTIPVAADIRTWLPGSFRLTAAGPIRVRPGHYSLALGIFDPMTDRPSIGFANDLPRVGGWTIVAETDIKNAKGPVSFHSVVRKEKS